jgi:hypothetical protein
MMLSAPNRLLPLALLILAAACDDAPGPGTPAPEAVTGCYTFRLGAWSGAHEAPEPPPAVRLMDSLGTFLLETGKPIVRPLPGDTLSYEYMAWWERPDPDSLWLYFSTGYVGVFAGLHWQDDQWMGKAEAVTDIVPPVQARTSAALLPLACP